MAIEVRVPSEKCDSRRKACVPKFMRFAAISSLSNEPDFYTRHSCDATLLFACTAAIVRMMLVLQLYSYCTGVSSSRKFAAWCEADVAFRVIVGDNIPDFRTISEYRRSHLAEFQHLFVEVLRLCRKSRKELMRRILPPAD